MITIEEQLEALSKYSEKNWQIFFDFIHNIDFDECEKIIIDTIS